MSLTPAKKQKHLSKRIKAILKSFEKDGYVLEELLQSTIEKLSSEILVSYLFDEGRTSVLQDRLKVMQEIQSAYREVGLN